MAACHAPRCHLAPSLGAPSSLLEHLTPTLVFRVDVGLQVARALPPPLQPTQQCPLLALGAQDVDIVQKFLNPFFSMHFFI